MRNQLAQFKRWAKSGQNIWSHWQRGHIVYDKLAHGWKRHTMTQQRNTNRNVFRGLRDSLGLKALTCLLGSQSWFDPQHCILSPKYCCKWSWKGEVKSPKGKTIWDIIVGLWLNWNRVTNQSIDEEWELSHQSIKKLFHQSIDEKRELSVWSGSMK